MQGITHLTIGAVSATILGASLSVKPEWALLMACAGAIGGLVPDIDHPNSMISHRLGLLRLLIFWIPHRTFTHSIFPVLALVLAVYLYPIPALAAFGLGYALHILADMATIQGVPFFTPLSAVRIRVLPGLLAFRTGGIREYIFMAIVLCFGLYVGVNQWIL